MEALEFERSVGHRHRSISKYGSRLAVRLHAELAALISLSAWHSSREKMQKDAWGQEARSLATFTYLRQLRSHSIEICASRFCVYV